MKRRKSYNKYRYVDKDEKKTEENMTFEDFVRYGVVKRKTKEQIRKEMLVKTAMLNIMCEKYDKFAI